MYFFYSFVYKVLLNFVIFSFFMIIILKNNNFCMHNDETNIVLSIPIKTLFMELLA